MDSSIHKYSFGKIHMQDSGLILLQVNLSQVEGN